MVQADASTLEGPLIETALYGRSPCHYKGILRFPVKTRPNTPCSNPASTIICCENTCFKAALEDSLRTWAIPLLIGIETAYVIPAKVYEATG